MDRVASMISTQNKQGQRFLSCAAEVCAQLSCLRPGTPLSVTRIRVHTQTYMHTHRDAYLRAHTHTNAKIIFLRFVSRRQLSAQTRLLVITVTLPKAIDLVTSSKGISLGEQLKFVGLTEQCRGKSSVPWMLQSE